MILLQLVIELFKRFEILNGDSHLFDPLHRQLFTRLGPRTPRLCGTPVTMLAAYLAHLQVPLGQLFQHILRAESIVQL